MTLLILRVGNTAIIIRNTDIKGILYETEIAYYMESQLNGLPFNNSYITLDEIGDFIQSKAVSNEIGRIAKKYASELSAGNLDYHITTGEVFIASQNLAPELFDLFGHHMTEADYRHFVRTLDDILDFRGQTINGLLEDFGTGAVVPRVLLSPFLVWGAGILWILSLLILCMHKKDDIKSVLLFAGVPVLLSGLIFLAAGVITSRGPELLGDTLYRFAGFAGGIIFLTTGYGIAFSAAGVFSAAAWFIFRCIDKSKNQC